MPGFCTNCGAPLAGPFCTKCGSRAAADSPSPGPQSSSPQPVMQAPGQSVPPPAGTASKGSGMKVLVIVASALLALFVLGAAGAIYGVYWVKHKVARYSSSVTGGSSAPLRVVEQGNSCRLLSTAELQQVLGVAVEKSAEIMEGSDPGCAYYTNPQAFTQLQRMAVELARRQSEEASKQPGPASDNPLALLKNTNQMEGIVKSFGLSQPDKEGRVFSFSVQRDYGRGNWNTLRTTLSVVPGFEDVTGVGDRAMMGSFGHAIYVLKGDSVVHLELTFVPDARNRGAEIGRLIVSRM